MQRLPRQQIEPLYDEIKYTLVFFLKNARKHTRHEHSKGQ